MAGKGKNAGVTIVIKREEGGEAGHHGGAWKVAYADFVTAMMAFFLLMWLLNATSEEQRRGLADYFSPSNVLARAASGSGQPFGGRTPNSGRHRRLRRRRHPGGARPRPGPARPRRGGRGPARAARPTPAARRRGRRRTRRARRLPGDRGRRRGRPAPPTEPAAIPDAEPPRRAGPARAPGLRTRRRGYPRRGPRRPGPGRAGPPAGGGAGAGGAAHPDPRCRPPADVPDRRRRARTTAPAPCCRR